MDKIFIFVLFFYFCSAKVTIKNLDVPASISVHKNEVVLDCDFDSQGEKVEYVKWFLNGTSKLIYQWIPQQNTGPTVLETFRDRIDVNYGVKSDNETLYRAIHIKKLSPDLSGNYSCKVSGTNTEDTQTKGMIIYDPANSGIDLNITEDFSPDLNATEEDDLLAISCSAEGIYPEPDIRIYVTEDNITEIESEHTEESLEIVDSNVYNVSSTVVYDKDKLPSTFYFTCELTIPGTDYTEKETRKHILESDNDTRIESEEDYLNLLNSTNTTESSLEESEELETQVEENKEITLKTAAAEPATNKDDDDTVKMEDNKVLKDNGGFTRFPNYCVLLTLALALLAPTNL